jgi:alpha-galactosidase/6-phospho-beta-glucosidase family protein
VSPLAAGPLPEPIAEIVRRHQVSFELAARATLRRDHGLLVQAVQLCPFVDTMTSAENILADARAEFGGELIF